MILVNLKPGREKSLLRRHPWIFSGAIDSVVGNPEPGETVKIHDSNGRFQAWGAYSPDSQIRVRVWSWNPNDNIGHAYFHKRLTEAIDYRSALFGVSGHTIHSHRQGVLAIRSLPSAVRLVNAEADGMPGLIVDRYEETLVLQFLCAGVEYWRDTIIELLLELTNLENVFERSDADVRKLEGLKVRVGTLYGAPPERLSITENNLSFLVDLIGGQKTGFYLDQRLNRERIQKLSWRKEVLDCFSYTGGFTVNALAGGAEFVTAVDRSKDALDLAHQNVKLNLLPLERAKFLDENVFKQLRKFRDQARQFDLIILDPPKFAPTASQVHKATRGYKDINLLALKLIRPGGLLVTFSCSGGVDVSLFQKILAGAVVDAGVSAKIVSRLEQSPDHPVSLTFPESAYLKGLIIRVS